MKEKIKENRNLIIKITVALICVALLAGLVVVQYIYRSFTTYRTVKEVEMSGVSERRTIKMGDHLVVYNKDGMRCMDAKGKTVWDVTYQIQEPCVVADGDLIAVGGYGDSKIYIMDDVGKVGEINTNLPIRNMCIAEAGYVAAVLDDNDVYWIYLYDTDGEEMAKARVTMKQHGYPLSISLSSNGKLLGVSYIYLDAGVMESRVAFYNFGEVGQNYTDQFMSSFIYREIVPELHYMNSSVAMGVANDRLMVYSGSEKPAVLKEVLLNQEVQGVYWGDENVVLVYKGTSEQGKYFIQVYDMTGTLAMEKGFDLEYTGITSQNGIITIYNSNDVLVYTLDGRERYRGDLDSDIKSIVSTSVKYKYLVLCDEEYKVIELE
jgi:hypothetical protein